MIATFTALLFAHTLADFIFQNDWIVANKRRPLVLLLHGAIVLITLQAAVGDVSAWPLLALAAAHMVIDAVKTALPVRGLWPYLGDQAAHMITLIVAAILFPTLWSDGVWGAAEWLPGAMAIGAGLILAVRAGAFAVGLLMAPWAAAELPKGLENGGQLIGILERGLIFLLVMVGQPAGVGFLIAAKSVLRFDTTARDQQAGEYVIIGTLASFGWALTMAYGTLALLDQLPPLGIGDGTP